MIHKLKQLFSSPNKKSRQKIALNPELIPRHVAIIMDGNGRWAKKRGLPRVAGHREGMKTVRRITRVADELGIEVLTLYAFSTENWKRPAEEVSYLMKLPVDFLATELPELIERNVQVRSMGSEEGLPEHTIRAVHKFKSETAHNTGMILNFALNYGSRSELVQAVKKIAARVETGELKGEHITEQLVGEQLLSHALPDPDLLIRTSGEIRLSNFMLWQMAYAELWFTDILWPDFNEQSFRQAILAYQQRSRRYGSI
ncbi:isoprenyl transferase [Numidum massiliense]|uniref:isoprenyl transferase n=1 Tax=Numidum massiliense TaxID=1522315 RepID=UPI0006D532F9|nr:isoprenyl transferase [Numidum massiliense]